MPAKRSRRETGVLLVLAIAGAVAAIAMFGFALHLAGVNARAAQRADLAGVPHWALRLRSVDPICDWIAVVGIAIAIGAAVLLLAGKRARRLPGRSRWTIDLLWKCGAWSLAGHALLVFAFTPLADADDPVSFDDDGYIVDDEPPADFPEDYDDDNPSFSDGPFCSMGTPVRTPILVSIQPAPAAWRPVVAQAHPFTSWNDPVVLGTPTTSVANDPAVILRTMKRRLPRLAECYTHARTEGSGMILARFTIGWDGAAIDVRADGFDPVVAACVAKLVGQSHFTPPSDGAASAESEVRLPIHFRGRAY
jgi:hypothetical protein